MVALWIDLLLRTSFDVTYDEYGNKLEPGQLSTGRRQLAASTGLTESQIRTCLDKLKSSQQISQLNKSKCSIITILNWEEYKISVQQSVQQIASRSPHLKNVKNSISNSKNTITYTANDILRNIHVALGREQIDFYVKTLKPSKTVQEKWIDDNTPQEISDELYNFTNYLKSKGKRYKNYSAAFSNWLRSPYRSKGETNERNYRTNPNLEEEIRKKDYTAGAPPGFIANI